MLHHHGLFRCHFPRNDPATYEFMECLVAGCSGHIASLALKKDLENRGTGSTGRVFTRKTCHIYFFTYIYIYILYIFIYIIYIIRIYIYYTYIYILHIHIYYTYILYIYNILYIFIYICLYIYIYKELKTHKDG